jgi:NAD(P)-dependent dehydrogenase (short-subunit alcohol dehydrogenase family)
MKSIHNLESNIEIDKGSILLTSANGGLGTAIAKQMTSRLDVSGYYGIYRVTNETAPALRPVLKSHHTHAHQIVSIDLTDFDSIRQSAKKINERVACGIIPPIRALILNAAHHNFNGQTFGAD